MAVAVRAAANSPAFADTGRFLSAYRARVPCMETVSRTQERDDLSATLAKQRSFLHQAVRGLTDEQAAMRPTPSELCLGGIVKHVSSVEQRWMRFILEGPGVLSSGMDPAAMEAHAATFRMLPDDTLDSLLAAYAEAAAGTEKVLYWLDSLDVSQPLPSAPWFEPGERWTARTVFLHVLKETAQHCGHADIIREAIDGAKTMG